MHFYCVKHYEFETRNTASLKKYELQFSAIDFCCRFFYIGNMEQGGILLFMITIANTFDI